MKKDQDKKINPEEYRAILDTVDLKTIALEASSVKFKRDKYGSPLVISINSDSSFENHEDDLVEVKEHYKLTARLENERAQAINISCTYSIYFSSPEPLKDDFFEVFKQFNLPLNTWPYFREFVQNMTQRMNIPPLTLPFMRT